LARGPSATPILCRPLATPAITVPAPPPGAPPDDETTSLTNRTDRRSGTAIVRSVALVGIGRVWYGNELPRTVVGASGSLVASKLVNVANPDLSAVGRCFARRRAGRAGNPATALRSLPSFRVRSS